MAHGAHASRSGSGEILLVDARGRTFAEVTLEEAHRAGADPVLPGRVAGSEDQEMCHASQDLRQDAEVRDEQKS